MHYKFHVGAEARFVAAWVASKIPGCERGFDACIALSVGSPLVAGVVFHNWNPEGGVMEMSAAADSPRWLSRPVLRAMHSYIFDDAACQIAVLRVSERNERMLKIAERYGYTAHRIPRLRGRNEAEVVLTLTDDDWRASKFHKR